MSKKSIIMAIVGIVIWFIFVFLCYLRIANIFEALFAAIVFTVLICFMLAFRLRFGDDEDDECKK